MRKDVRKESRPFVVRTPDGTRINLVSSAIDSETGTADSGVELGPVPSDCAVRPVERSRVDDRLIKCNTTVPPDLEAGSKSILKTAFKALKE